MDLRAWYSLIWTLFLFLFPGLETLPGNAEDIHAPCYACRIFNLMQRDNPKHDPKLEEFCEFPCQCPIMELKCNEGVKVIRDGCDCCYMCARQHGDRCSPKERCAEGLYCHLGDDNRGVGICKVKPSTNPPVPQTTTPPIRPPCAIVQSEWSACSASCGVGMSVRMTNDNLECEDVQQTRICFIRPCGELVKSEKRTKCTPTAKGTHKHRIEFQDCRSVKEHRLKFCSNCKKNRCCYPQITRHRTIEFECSKRERVHLSFMWIKKCQCGHKCYGNRIIDS